MPLNLFNKKNSKKGLFSHIKHKKSSIIENAEIKGDKFKDLWKKIQKEHIPKLIKQKEFEEKSEKFKQVWEKFQQEDLEKVLYLAFKHGRKIIPDLLRKRYLLVPMHLYSLLLDIGEQYGIEFTFLEKTDFSALKDYEQLETIIKMVETIYKIKEQSNNTS